MVNEKSRASSGFESDLKFSLRSSEIQRLVKVRGRQVSESFRVARFSLQDLFELIERVVVFLTINEVQGGAR